MTGEYTVATAVASVAVVALELGVLRTGIFRSGRYWATLAMVLAFQIPVDGLLTAGPTPIVGYRADVTSGIRFPWDIPIEDFGFGFALTTLTLALWVRFGRRPVAARLPEPAAQKVAAALPGPKTSPNFS